ncbi:large ribosomal subunit protein mL38-like [Amphiura filiformis]|uniref:large ribosomal subunit protein mL38-like n=1 Tax=Amphiura filiformis TaxID=82378 RepID=UPI003B216FBB
MAAPTGLFRRLLSTQFTGILSRIQGSSGPSFHQQRCRLSRTTNCYHEGASAGIDIGLPERKVSKRRFMREQTIELRKIKKNVELERAARRRTLLVPLDDVYDESSGSSGQFQTRRMAHHYGIFADLFDSADFLDVVPMTICYECSDGESVMPVYTGNVVTPTEACKAPSVSYDSTKDSLWTLMLTNPDGHLQDNQAEYIHWLVGNIPGDAVSDGDVLLDYLPPFPARGTGYHRLVFVLFQQNGKVDYSQETVSLPCTSLQDRTFSTLEFYRKYQNMITPAGLRFFQCRWDESVQGIYHNTLNMREPVFEYDFPPTYLAPQKKWPHKKPLHYLEHFMPKE